MHLGSNIGSDVGSDDGSDVGSDVGSDIRLDFIWISMTGMHLKNAWKGGNPALEAPVVEVQEGARSARCHARAGCWTFGWHHFERTQTLEAEREGEILTGGVGGVGGAVVMWGEGGGEG